ncbi:MAG: ABC transporter ATP-binding protein [Verrucomicrobia bacterium]|nr:ABC transporter ATP-binding protein [Verrucomicrobiota bacterium]
MLSTTNSPPPHLQVVALTVWFPIRSGAPGRRDRFVKAATDVSLSISPGKTLGLVGESGSGKTTVGKAILRLVPITSGTIRLAGTDITTLPESRFRPFRRQVQMIFQDPFGSLNPRWNILRIINEPLKIHFPGLNRSQREERVVQLLRKVGLSANSLRRYPHEFSGGQRQRIGIARALAVEPKLIVCDEAVSALDVSVQAQIVNLLQDLQQELGLSYLFISHDLAVVEHISHDVAVMYRGKIVEKADAASIYRHPQHEYTRNLLASVPSVD